MLTMYDNEQYFFQALRTGAARYVLKSVADRDLLEACHAAIRGPSFTRSGERADPQLAEPCPVRSGDPGADTDSPRGGGPQTRREGHSSKEIADTLFISIKRSSGTGRTCSRSLDSATAWSSPATQSGRARIYPACESASLEWCGPGGVRYRGSEIRGDEEVSMTDMDPVVHLALHLTGTPPARRRIAANSRSSDGFLRRPAAA